jgi:hypothetical protein
VRAQPRGLADTTVVHTQHRNADAGQRIGEVAQWHLRGLPPLPSLGLRPVISTAAGTFPCAPFGVVSVPANTWPCGAEMLTPNTRYAPSGGAAFSSGAVQVPTISDASLIFSAICFASRMVASNSRRKGAVEGSTCKTSAGRVLE